MIAFFDTNIYINHFRDPSPTPINIESFDKYIIRICPVVYHELIRCIREESRNKVETSLERLLFLPPPSTKIWITAGQLAGKVLGNFDERSLEKIQNDLLIALTARENGVLLITQDRFFETIQKKIKFQLLLL